MPLDVTVTLTDEEVAAVTLAATDRGAPSGLKGAITPTVPALTNELAHNALTGVVSAYRQVNRDSIITKLAALKTTNLTTVASALAVPTTDLTSLK